MSVDVTSDEASALDEAIRASGAEPAASAPGDVSPYDLTGSRHVNRSLPSLTVLDDRTASLLALDLTRSLRSDHRVTVETSGITRAEAFLNTLEAPGCFNVVELDGLGSQAVLAVEEGLLFGLLERMFGGRKPNPMQSQKQESRARLSAIEQTVVRRLVQTFGRVMEQAWASHVSLRVRHDRTETKPGNIGIAKPGDSLVATTFRVSADQLDGVLHFALPLSALDAHKEEFDVVGERSAERDEQWRASQHEAIRRVAVDVVAELGRASIPLRQLLRMEPGEILRLDQAPEDPVLVRVEGVTKFVGIPTVRYGNLAVELAARVDAAPTAATKESSWKTAH